MPSVPPRGPPGGAPLPVFSSPPPIPPDPIFPGPSQSVMPLASISVPPAPQIDVKQAITIDSKSSGGPPGFRGPPGGPALSSRPPPRPSGLPLPPPGHRGLDIKGPVHVGDPTVNIQALISRFMDLSEAERRKLELGHGSYGYVYRFAFPDRAGNAREFAVKTIGPKDENRYFDEYEIKGLEKSYNQEVQALEKFKDDCKESHILCFVGALRFEHWYFIVTEFAQGYETLIEFEARKIRLEDAKLLNFFQTITQAVKTIHDEKWIHNDVAHRNIMINPKTGDAILIDLGISRQEYKLEQGEGQGEYEPGQNIADRNSLRYVLTDFVHQQFRDRPVHEREQFLHSLPEPIKEYWTPLPGEASWVENGRGGFDKIIVPEKYKPFCVIS